MGQGSILLTIAWRNLWRNRTRTILTALTMGLGVAFCIFMNSWVGGFLSVMHKATVDRNLGHLQIHHKDYPETMNPYDVVPNAPTVIDALLADPDIKVVAPRIQAFAMYAGADNEAASGSFVGVDIVAEAALTEINKRVIDGRWLADKDEAVIGNALADKLDLKVGGQLLVVVNALDGSIGNKVYPVVGIYKVGTVERDAGAMFSIKTAQDLFVMGDGVHELVVLAQNEGALAQVQERAQKERPNLAVRAWYEISPETKQMEDITLISSLVFVIIIMLLTGFMIINTLLMSVYERTRELGLLASLGLPPKSVTRLILIESGLLGLISSTVGFVLGMLGHLLLSTKGIPMEVKEGEGFVLNGVVLDPVIYGHLEVIQVLIPMMVVIAVSLLAGIWPARRAVNLDPVTALAQR